MATVSQIYDTYLGRTADPGGLKYWTDMFGSDVDPTELSTFLSVAAKTEPGYRPPARAPSPSPSPSPAPSGSGGASGASTTTIYQTSIPDYAKETVERMLGRAEALSTSPYQPYSGERTAQFTPMQLRAFEAAQQMTPSQLTDQAGNLARTAGLSAMGAGQYSPYQTGQFSPQAANYMSPYMQNVVDIEKREAARQNEIARQGRQAQAVQAGAFGGSRQAIMEAEANRNLMQQMGDIQSRGLQSAYDQARQQFNTEQQLREQSRQYGAGLGLQGLQTALQGAGVMGGLGQQQFGQQMDITDLQQRYGTQQQQRIQDMLTQQYQDFLNQQRFPYQQIGFMSDILRGLPMSQSTQSIYAPPPSMANTLGGLGMMAYGSGLFKAKGGSIPSYAKGGTVGAGLADLAISNMA